MMCVLSRRRLSIDLTGFAQTPIHVAVVAIGVMRQFINQLDV